jgi:hypothetical protein
VNPSFSMTRRDSRLVGRVKQATRARPRGHVQDRRGRLGCQSSTPVFGQEGISKLNLVGTSNLNMPEAPPAGELTARAISEGPEAEAVLFPMVEGLFEEELRLGVRADPTQRLHHARVAVHPLEVAKVGLSEAVEDESVSDELFDHRG